MDEDDLKRKEAEVKQTLYSRAKAWGDHSLPPAILATLVFAQHARPFQPLPMIFPPVLMFASYVNLNGYTRDAAGISAAWSGLYMLLALRRRQGFRNKVGVRGVVRGASLGLAAVNLVGGGVSYAFGQKGRGEDWIGKGKE